MDEVGRIDKTIPVDGIDEDFFGVGLVTMIGLSTFWLYQYQKIRVFDIKL